ncbi:cob(I)yrinic acid a,c-diamide adenosyltransferase [Nocardioides euryhalodurans]|uniref:Cob(I)yrinic acid a,c-diamide adenosyltransferase n=1 Tax=Nocardioides euryhalodurans TaxID=2518370 RepID=A0A4P7GPR2_9ACTN|nr:cob(I)yrinic acid a,c-diamide adenosyltransferase [Nocardioides euryhalodurans]QBR93974.1 cob(I)yrinic acid a,c-diamide adenosyltransferase [Nocardioides euryhalodurans]
MTPTGTPREALPDRERTRPPRRDVASIVLVATGDGKGKSTAAFGTVMRAVAREWSVCVVQFMKSGKWRVGEEAVARRLGVEWWTIGDGFTWESDDLDRSATIAREAWTAAAEALSSGRYDLVVLDEMTYPVNYGWIEADPVWSAIRDRAERTNVFCTGRNAPAELVELADTVTEMRKVKHAYETGVRARRGLDF